MKFHIEKKHVFGGRCSPKSSISNQELWSKYGPLEFTLLVTSMFIKLKWPFWNHQGTSHFNNHYSKVLQHFDTKFQFFSTSQVRCVYSQIVAFLYFHTKNSLQHLLDALSSCNFTQSLVAFLWSSVWLESRSSPTVYGS